MQSAGLPRGPRPPQTIAHTAAQGVMCCIFGLPNSYFTGAPTEIPPTNAVDATARTTVLLMVLVQGGGRVPAATPNKKPRDYHEARGSGAGPSRACCRKPLMNSRSSTAMPSSDAASSGAPDDASSAESESDTDTVDTAARAGGRGAGAVARGARGRRAGSSIVANDSTAGSRE